MRAITAVNSEIETLEGISNNRAGPVSAQLGKQAVEHKKDPNRINPRTEEIPRRTAKKNVRFKKRKRSEGEGDRFWRNSGVKQVDRSVWSGGT